MKTLVLLSVLLAAVHASHHASPRAYSSGSHGRSYGYSLPSGHARFSSYAKSHHYAPRPVKYVHKPIVKVVEVPKTVYKHVPHVVEKVVEVPRVVYKEKVIVKEVPREIIREVPKIIVKEVPQYVVKHVPKVVVKEVEVPQVVYKHVPVTQEVRVAAPVAVHPAPVAVHAAPAVRVAHAAPVAVHAAPAVRVAHAAPVAVHAAPAVRVAHAAPVAVAPAPAVRVAHPVAAAPLAPAFPYAAAVSSQYHAQDELGQYDYGFSGPLASKQEVKTADGVVRGQYSYLDANNQVQVASYYSDALGFHVARSDLPVAPSAPQGTVVAAVQETAEVAAARADHLRAHAEALEAAQE